jgi:hypothetical protein
MAGRPRTHKQLANILFSGGSVPQSICKPYTYLNVESLFRICHDQQAGDLVLGGGGYNGNTKNRDIDRGNETFGLPCGSFTPSSREFFTFSIWFHREASYEKFIAAHVAWDCAHDHQC